MKSVALRDAKAGFSGLVEEAMNGEMITITRHGKPAAVLVSVAEAKWLESRPRSAFGKFLLSYPGGAKLRRNRSRPRDAGL